MSQGFGITAVILTVVSIFIPVLGAFTTAIAMLLASIAALAGDRVFATISALLAATSLIFLSPAFLATLTAALNVQELSVVAVYLAIFLSPALPLVAMGLNATGRFALGKTGS
ncbi:MAG: hypothetical protein CML99_07165 [Rhodobiaceae bacterium]|nr:hypothetical protein [Rhodobiaceae bacterium]|tara:strand:+ start:3490 stop:3828 length:339 start_codon:yes stop_codon:yes gene_type:complete